MREPLKPSEPADDQEFLQALEHAAQQCHEEVVRHATENPEYHGMATTLTMWLSSWPRAFLLQVGDSRCYLLRGNELTQITRDQTMAQELIDLGVLTLCHHAVELDRWTADRAGRHSYRTGLGQRGALVQ